MGRFVPFRKCAICDEVEGVYQRVSPDGNIELLCRQCRDKSLKGRPAYQQAGAIIENARISLMQKEHKREKNRRRKMARRMIVPNISEK